MAIHSINDQDGAAFAGGRKGPHPLALAWFVLVVALFGGILAIAFLGQSADGIPKFQVALSPPHAAATRHPPPPGAAPVAAGGQPAAQAGAPPSGTGKPAGLPQTGIPAIPAMPAPQMRLPSKITTPLYAGTALIADPALIEQTPQGPLPRIADDGRKPLNAYAPVIPAAALAGKKPIALVISGLGISARATQAALDGLPSGVTLAFAPYDDDVQRWVAEARRRGHEVLLEVPMEPYDFPDSDPGPHTLRPTLTEEDNLSRLKWSLTRFTGYAGVTNLLGGRFLASPEATGPVLAFLARRGILFYDSGTTARSAAASVARDLKAPYAASSLELDSIQSGMEIDQRLSELENRARANGFASGTGFVYPVTVARIAAWARGLDARGFVLVPASSIVTANP